MFISSDKIEKVPISECWIIYIYIYFPKIWRKWSDLDHTLIIEGQIKHAITNTKLPLVLNNKKKSTNQPKISNWIKKGYYQLFPKIRPYTLRHPGLSHWIPSLPTTKCRIYPNYNKCFLSRLIPNWGRWWATIITIKF